MTVKHWVELVLGLLLAGGLTTSTFEYKKKYNLIDYLLDFVRSAEAKTARLFALAKSSEQRATALLAKEKAAAQRVIRKF